MICILISYHNTTTKNKNLIRKLSSSSCFAFDATFCGFTELQCQHCDSCNNKIKLGLGRIKEYPKEPLPSIQFLQMDFDTCVLEQNPECRYVQDSDVEPVDCIECGGHFSQMAQFCGHDPV